MFCLHGVQDEPKLLQMFPTVQDYREHVFNTEYKIQHTLNKKADGTSSGYHLSHSVPIPRAPLCPPLLGLTLARTLCASPLVLQHASRLPAPDDQTQFTLGFLRRLAMYDHVVALNSPRLIPSGVHRKTERDMAVSTSTTALVNSGGNSSARPYSMPSGYGAGLGLSGSALRPRVGSMEFDAGATATDSLEPHWLLELCIQVPSVFVDVCRRV